ncbi:amidohydrolase family protein [Kribbella kalugense]|uniref:Putative TIM-barrel fold metal-dependent hydrolase n=1 Tax=Kribbella kalugense TaxID=2512221 RepID=A0A4R7ZXT0_9ACTN|nr:amidohydrolase family protein [Kribbella kalugense]TDW21738.1 putative TIM-barrel fold metal-dependent hydrolase [Kribbella kalugense]
MRVIDVNRIVGPVPTGDVPSNDAPGLLGELDRLAIDAACVVHSHDLYYNPTAAAALPADPRLIRVPVVVPGPLGSTASAKLVRMCPTEHRFPLTGPHGLAAARELSECGTSVLLTLENLGEIHRLATEVPALRIVLINTGYRSLRELADLMDVHPEVRVDTSTLCGHLHVEWIAERYGAHRVLFGTGAPVTDDAGPRFQLDHLELPAADVELIAGGNVLELLG